LIAARLFGITALDPVTLAGATMLLAAAAAVACWLPARRAARTDPAEVLRST
jgi:ABC-type lipoprotein release transport system permease subunit